MKIIATTTMGLESIVKNECEKLNFENVKAFNGRVEFEGDEKTIVMANIHLRCADRVYLKMGEFNALTFEELFQEIKKIRWSDLLPIDAEFPISWVSSVKSKLYSKSDIQRITKKAIVENLREKYKIDNFKENGSKYSIKIQANKDNFIVMVDTSGEALHKRGYRYIINEAPLKETMAAALVYLSKWNYRKLLLDPMCGTGTIAIEAAMMAKNIAPGVNRNFISEKWSLIPKEIWINVRDEAYSNEKEEIELKIIANDIDKNVIEIAKHNASEAGVEDVIIFLNEDFRTLEIKDKYGDMITNPPYGERLMEEENIELFNLYKDLGHFCKTSLKNWSKYVITSYEDFEKTFGLKAAKNRKLYNGGIKTYFYQYFGVRNGKNK